MTTIRTDEGVLGRALQAKRGKIKGDEATICETRLQMPATRAQLESLAGFPPGFVEHLFNAEGAPVAHMEIRIEKRELHANGKCWRGDKEHAQVLAIKRGTASNLRFKLEPNGAIFICSMRWRAAGDETEECDGMLGQWCSIEMTFKHVEEQQAPLQLDGDKAVTVTVVEGGGERPKLPGEDLPPGVPEIPSLSGQEPHAIKEARLRERLVALGFEVPNDPRVWYGFSSPELQKVMRYVDRVEAGEKPYLPATIKQWKRKEQPSA